MKSKNIYTSSRNLRMKKKTRNESEMKSELAIYFSLRCD